MPLTDKSSQMWLRDDGLVTIGTALRGRRLRSADVLAASLDRYDESVARGQPAFTALYRASAAAEAAAADARFERGAALSPIDGITVSVKDLCGVSGEATLAGAKALRDHPPETRDSVVVDRLRKAGAVILGKTNMTEFAFSGVGLNPHFGSPWTPWRSAERRLAGGSSSGAAVSVAENIVAAAIGSDTGGSIRVPAAFCGVVGFKPTAARVSREGCFELSRTLDSLGPIARSVECCRIIDAVIADRQLEPFVLDQPPIIGVPGHYLLDGCDEEVTQAFEQALAGLEAAGARIVALPADSFALAQTLVATGSFATLEGWERHGALLREIAPAMDPFVYVRFRQGEEAGAGLHAELVALRRRLIERSAAEMAGVDAVVLPTVPILPPPIAELEDYDAFLRINGLSLRNTCVANFIDGCAITIPVAARGGAPVGLSFMGGSWQDHIVLAVAAWAERALCDPRRKTGAPPPLPGEAVGP